MVYQYSIDMYSLPLSTELILREMGYGKTKPRENLYNWVQSSLEEVASIANPSCSFGLYDGMVCGEEIILENGISFHVGKILSSLLEGSRRFALFTATAGSAYQAYQKELNVQGDVLCCYILDVIGSCLVEMVGDQMENLLEQTIYPEQHTHRFSPGYCGWDLMEQNTLFSLLGGAPCGIQLSDVCLMIPEKSISGIIGIGPEVNEKAYGCKYCELEACYKRKRKKI